MATHTTVRDYATSRVLAGLTVLAPVLIWALAPSDENGFRWSGTFYAMLVSGLVFALIAAFSASWATRIPLYVAGASWAVILGTDLAYDGGGDGIGAGLIAMPALATAGIATVAAMLTPLNTRPKN